MSIKRFQRRGKKEIKKELFVVDTEDDSKAGLYWIIFYNGKKYYTYKTVEEAMAFIENYQTNVLCFAVNLEYDILNIFRGHYADIKWVLTRSRIISVKYKKFLFYDTLNHWKKSVKEMGEYLKAKKLPFKPQSEKYCKMDCKVTYDFVRKMYKLYDKIGFQMKSTLPSTTYNYWLRNYAFKLEILKKEELDTFKKSYYGARTECFYIGKIKGKIYSIDINALYPFVMTKQYPYPYSWSDKFDLTKYRSEEHTSELQSH